MCETIRIRKWEHWQSYRRDRGQPPWIKVHREVMRNPDWVSLTDAQRGQLVGIWLLAADRDGVIPASPKLIQKLCYMDSEPDLQVFVDHGFIEPDANVTPSRRQSDETEAETEAEKEIHTSAKKRPTFSNDFQELWDVCKRGSRKQAFDQYHKARVGKRVEHEVLLSQWKEHVAAASGPEFVAHLFRWLRDERWEEAVPSVNGNKPPDLRPARFY